MNKIKEFYQKDKPKFIFICLMILAIIVSIILGVVYSDENTDKQAEIDAVEVPIDTVAINKDKQQYVNNDEFFQMEKDTFVDPGVASTEVSQSEVISNEPKKKLYQPSYKTYSTSSGGSINYKKSNPVSVPEPASSTTSKSRKRVPSDAFTVTSSSSKSKSSSICKVVIDNRNRTVKSGSTVYMHASNDFTLSGVTVPKNTLLQGVASFNGERLKIVITQVKVKNEFYNVKWKVYDNGIDGIYCPERVGDDIAKGTAKDAIENNKIETNVPVIGSVRVSLSKKNNESSVVIPDGYKCTVNE